MKLMLIVIVIDALETILKVWRNQRKNKANTDQNIVKISLNPQKSPRDLRRLAQMKEQTLKVVLNCLVLSIPI